MGIVSSTLASLAIQLAWNCQRYLDPQYHRCLEDKGTSESSATQRSDRLITDYKQQSVSTTANKRSSTTHLSEIRRRHAMNRQRYRRRPASFDNTLIANRSDNPSTMHVTCVVTSTPSLKHTPLRRPQPQFWDVTSSSGCSSDSGSDSDSDSYVDDRLNEAFIRSSDRTEEEKEFPMSADEEAALRITVGRGYFSKSKRDQFLNHLRLEKRLSYLNDTFSGTLQRGYGRGLCRRYSGDLHMV